ncbi:hypothetical protein TNCV_4135331 [Trichonephila clavipes]|nr:hypothetical protein TNCV_4135331 [Trichonephila clavipes]
MRVIFLTRYDSIRERPLSSLPCVKNVHGSGTFPNDWVAQSEAYFSKHEKFHNPSTSTYQIWDGRPRAAHGHRRCNLHRFPTRWLLSGTRLKLMTCQPRVH